MARQYVIRIRKAGRLIGYLAHNAVTGSMMVFDGDTKKPLPLIFDSRVGAEIVAARWEATFEDWGSNHGLSMEVKAAAKPF